MRLELVLDLLRRRLVDWTLRDSDVGLIQHGVELSRRQKAIIIFISPLGLMRPVRKCCAFMLKHRVEPHAINATY